MQMFPFYKKSEYIIPLSLLIPDDGIDKSPPLSEIKSMLVSKDVDVDVDVDVEEDKESEVNKEKKIDVATNIDQAEKDRRLKRKNWCKLDETFPVDSEEGRDRIIFLRKLKFLLKYVAGRRSYHNFVTGGCTLNFICAIALPLDLILVS